MSVQLELLYKPRQPPRHWHWPLDASRTALSASHGCGLHSLRTLPSSIEELESGPEPSEKIASKPWLQKHVEDQSPDHSGVLVDGEVTIHGREALETAHGAAGATHAIVGPVHCCTSPSDAMHVHDQSLGP